jgi:methyl-accepting chemotaxis protein
MKKIFKYFSGLRLKIFIIIFLFSLLIVFIYSYFYIKNTNKLLKENSERIAGIGKSVLSKEIEMLIFTGDSTFISPIIRSLLKDPLILKISIKDSLNNEILNFYKENFLKEKSLFFSYPVFTKFEGKNILLGKMEIYISEHEIIKERSKGIFLSFILGIVIIIFGFIFSIFVTNFFFKIIERIKISLIEIAKGEADLTKRIEIKEDAEFKEIANSFNNFIESLSKRIFITKATASKSIEFSENVSSAIEEITASSNEVTDTVQKLSHMATESAKNVLEASRSVKELLDLALTTNEEAKEMHKIEEYSYNLALEGRKISENVSEELGKVTNAFNKLRESVDNLSVLLKDILEISNTITIFMRRTNLLSLNASIEAARAGFYGKGFSIVANEIRKLAEDSSVYAEKIQEVVERIKVLLEEHTKNLIENQKIIENAKEVVLGAANQLKKIADQSEEAMEKIEKITKLTNVQKEEIEKLALFMDKVGQAVEEVSVASEEIAASMEEQLASLEEISASTQELAHVSQELKESLRGFKIE